MNRWRVMKSSDGFVFIGDENTIDLGSVLGLKNTVAEVWREDDANLMAAAPDLLIALQALRGNWNNPKYEIRRKCLQAADDAISKAGGKI